MTLIQTPKLSFIADESLKAIKRFPLPILYSFLAGIAIFNEQNLVIIFTLILAIPLSIGLTIISSQSPRPLFQKLLPHLVHPITLSLYWFMKDWPHTKKFGLQYFIYAVIIHLFVAISNYYQGQDLRDFWRFNQRLFERILISLIFTHTLFLGLSLSLLLLAILFNLEIHALFYSNLWYFCIFFFNTIFFVSGVPLGRELEDTEFSYPKKLKLFVEYILIPLLVLYFVILYIYLLTIIVSQTLPKGQIGALVSFASVFGIFTLLLGYPLFKTSERNWFKFLFKGFFLAVIPLTITMFVGIYIRISQYGITEDRYLLTAIGVWLLGISIYYSLSRKINIRIIPFSLLVIAILISFGPWSLWNLSLKSQKSRLFAFMHKHQLIENDLIQKSKGSLMITEAEYEEISSIIRYLINTHGKSTMDKMLASDIPRDFKEYDLLTKLEIFKSQEGMINDAYLTSEGGGAWNIKGHDFLLEEQFYNDSKFKLNGHFEISYSDNMLYVHSLKDARKHKVFDIREFYKALLEKYPTTYSIPKDAFSLESKNKEFNIKIYFKDLQKTRGKKNHAYTFRAKILFKENE